MRQPSLFLSRNQTHACVAGDLSIMAPAKDLAERRFQQKQEGAKALTDYQAKEQATRLLTVKLRAERLARESKPRRKRKTKSSAS